MFCGSIFCSFQSRETEGGGIAAPSILAELPTELKRRIAVFLPAQDLLALTETSRRIRSDLNIKVKSSPLVDQKSRNKPFMTFYNTELFAAIVSKQEPEPSLVVFSCSVVADRLSDGALWIVEQDLSQNHSNESLIKRPKRSPFRNGKVIAFAGTSSKRKLVLEFIPKANKFYQFWVNTRGYKETTKLFLNEMAVHRIGLGKTPQDFSTFQYAVIPWYVNNGRYSLPDWHYR